MGFIALLLMVAIAAMCAFLVWVMGAAVLAATVIAKFFTDTIGVAPLDPIASSIAVYGIGSVFLGIWTQYNYWRKKNERT